MAGAGAHVLQSLRMSLSENQFLPHSASKTRVNALTMRVEDARKRAYDARRRHKGGDGIARADGREHPNASRAGAVNAFMIKSGADFSQDIR
jgi:hypothetical protein